MKKHITPDTHKNGGKKRWNEPIPMKLSGFL